MVARQYRRISRPAFAKQRFIGVIGVSEGRHAAGMTFIPAAVKNFIA
jgi:hypothetical protein